MAREHNCPAPRVSTDHLNEKRQILAYRTWATISSSFSRHSGRRAELALTEEANIIPYSKLHKGQDEPSKLRRSFREVPSFNSCFFSSISFAATSCAYSLFFRTFTIPGLWSLSNSQVTKPFGAHLKASSTNRRFLEGMPNASKLWNVIVTTVPVTRREENHTPCSHTTSRVCCRNLPKRRSRSQKPPPQCWFLMSEVMIRIVLDSRTYASSVALLSHECTSMIAACPDSPFEITSCHLSASYRVTRHLTPAPNVSVAMTNRIGTSREAGE